MHSIVGAYGEHCPRDLARAARPRAHGRPAYREWVARLGRVWVEGQVAQLTRRPGAAHRLPHAARPGRRRLAHRHLPRAGAGRGRAAARRGGARRRARQARLLPRPAARSRCPPPRSGRSASASCWPGSSSSGRCSRPRACSRPAASGRCRSCRGRSAWSAGAARRPSATSSRTRGGAGRRSSSGSRTSPSRACTPSPRSSTRSPGWTATREVDVIVVTRGGGSVEDLLPVLRREPGPRRGGCLTPVVSAIGHEQDTPLLDLVADVRASTPTDAARRVVPDVREELDRAAAPARAGPSGRRGLVDREQHRSTAYAAAPCSPTPTPARRPCAEVPAASERARRTLGTGSSALPTSWGTPAPGSRRCRPRRPGAGLRGRAARTAASSATRPTSRASCCARVSAGGTASPPGLAR